MRVPDALYIDGGWRPARGTGVIEVFEAATGDRLATVPVGATEDVEDAVSAARAAFEPWSLTPVAERARLIRALASGLAAREDELAPMISREVGTPIITSRRVQVGLAVAVLESMAETVEALPAKEQIGTSLIIRQAAGVVGAITPWNYPIYQLAAKVGPALAAGCTVVVKPSSVAPLSAFVVAEVATEIGLPAGVLNIVTGAGRAVGEALVQHPDVDLVSLTGSTGAGARVAALAAASIKRTTLELGGKSAFLLCPGSDLDVALTSAVRSAFINNGQTCSATTRLLVPRSELAEIEERLAALVEAMVVGDPLDPATGIGPVASAGQQQSILRYLDKAGDDGTILTGGSGPVSGLDRGYYIRPTVIGRLDASSVLAREEIFGPVLSVLTYESIDEAVQIANDSDYGLSGAVWSPEVETSIAVARRLRTGQVSINGGRFNVRAPFGGFKRSGVGRELGVHGLMEYFELTALHLPAGGA